MSSGTALRNNSPTGTERRSSFLALRTISTKAILLMVAAVALVIRLVPLLRAGDHWTILDDSHEYLALVHGMGFGCGFARLVDGACRPPELLRLPGYPVFVYLMPSLRSVVGFQALFGAATCLAVGMFMLSRWGFAAAITAETLLALDIPSIVASSTIMSDCLFEMLLTFAVLLQLTIFARGEADRGATRLNLLASLLLGYAVLVRAVAVIAPIIAVVPFMFMPEISIVRRIRLASVSLALPLLVIAGWTIRNHAVSGRWVFTTEAAYNLYYYNAAGVLGYRTGENLTQLQSRLSRDIGAQGPDEEFSPVQQNEMTRRAIAAFVRHPLDTIADTLRVFAWLMIVPDRANLNALLGTNARSTVFLAASQDVVLRIRQMLGSPLLTTMVTIQMPFIFFMWGGVAISMRQIWRTSRDRLRYILIPLVVGIAMLLVGTGPGSIARFRLPAMPFLAMLCGIGWSCAWDRCRRRFGAERTLRVEDQTVRRGE